MDIQNRPALKAAAGEALSRSAYDPKKLILIHTGVTLLFSLVLTVISHLLQQQIGSTGGLSGLGPRTLLETAQFMLQIANVALSPFWQMGYLSACIAISRQEPLAADTLLNGFRRLGPVLRLSLLQLGILLFLTMVASNISSFLFLMTPWAADLMELLLPIMESSEPVVTEEMLSAMSEAMMPMMVLLFAVLAVIGTPVFYRLRMAEYALMDGDNRSALLALRQSMLLTRGRRFSLFKLDLSFWWYYGLSLLITAVGYSDLLLEALNIALPWSSTVSFFGAYILYLLGMLALSYFCKNKVAVTYAAAYDALREAPEPKAPPAPKNPPWNY